MQRYEKYKDSGIEWLGEVPEHWEDRKLGNILSPYSVKNRADLPLLSITREKGVIQRGEDPEDDNHNFIPDDLKGYKHLKIGQFGMNKMKAWQGSYGYSNFEGIVSPAYYIFDISSNLLGEYFSKTIRSKAYIPFFKKASDGVRIGQWDLSKQRMKEIPFFVPPLAEQKAITKFLDDKCGKIDGAINLKEQQIEKLKELRQITIQNAVTKGISHFKGEVVPTKDSEIDWIGEIPEHWEAKRLKTYTGLINGYAFNSDEFVSEGIQLLKIANLYNNKLSLDRQPTFISKDSLYKYKDWVVSRGDILISLTGTLGKRDYGYAIIIEKDDMFFLNQRVAKITHHSINKKYLLFILHSELFLAPLFSLPSGTKQANLSNDNILNIFIAVPPISEQEEIVAYLEDQTSKIDKAIAQKQEQIVKLKEYKQSLINEVVTGKLKVTE